MTFRAIEKQVMIPKGSGLARGTRPTFTIILIDPNGWVTQINLGLRVMPRNLCREAIQRMVVAIWSFMLFGCAEQAVIHSGPTFSHLTEPKEGYSIVYIWRERFGTQSPIDIVMNETKVVALRQGEYTYIEVRPGRYLIKTTKDIGSWGFTKGIEINSSPHETLFAAISAPETVNSDDSVSVVPINTFPIADFHPGFTRITKALWVQETRVNALRELNRYYYIVPTTPFLEK